MSHSFNQFILVDDEGYIVAADQGDAYPRAAILFKYTTKAGSSTVSTSNSSVNVLEFMGTTGENATYASLGGLEYSSTSYLLAGNSVTQDEDYASHTSRNIFVGVVNRDDVSDTGTTVKWITDYDTDGTVTTSTPQLVKLGTDSFLLMWTVNDSSSSSISSQGNLNYVFLDGEGNMVSEIYEVEGQLSDCQPILVDDMVVWYVTGSTSSYSSSTPVFYSIDLDGNYTVTVSLDTPDISVSATTEGIEVTWDAVDNAEGYEIYRKTESGSYSLVGTTTDTSWIDSDISADTLYTYQVYAYSGDCVSAGSGEKTGEIKDISSCTVTLSETNFIYDGTSKCPEVTVYDAEKELTLYSDFYLSYSDCISAGDVTVTIIGEGNYTGTITANYTIAKADQTLTAIMANDNLTVGDTCEITASGIGDISYSSSDESVVTVDYLGTVTAKKAGTATITVTAEGSDNYNSAIETIIVTVTGLDYVLGDINEDGFIDYLDAMTALRYDAELISLEEAQLLAGDVNNDGYVDSLDAILILRYDAGLIDEF